jgi:hypothetical protein
MKTKANPHYVSSLLGSLALAAAKDESRDIFDSIDYSSKEQVQLVVESLIRPSFERLADATRMELARALGYFYYRPDAASKVIEEKLLLCEVPPDGHRIFLEVMWDSLFPKMSAKDMAESVSGVVNRPLVMGEFSFAHKASMSLDELIDGLRAKLVG